MMPFEVSCANFKCCNKFLFLQYVSCFLFFFFFLKTYSPVSVFASFPTFFFFFFFAHHVLHKHAKKNGSGKPWKYAYDGVLFIFPAMSLSRSFEVWLLSLTSHLRDPLVFDSVSVQRVKPLLIPPLTAHPS